MPSLNRQMGTRLPWRVFRNHQGIEHMLTRFVLDVWYDTNSAPFCKMA